MIILVASEGSESYTGRCHPPSHQAGQTGRHSPNEAFRPGDPSWAGGNQAQFGLELKADFFPGLTGDPQWWIRFRHPSAWLASTLSRPTDDDEWIA